MDFLALQDSFPPSSVEFVGNNQVKLNWNALTDKQLALNSSAVEPIATLLNELVKLTDAINESRSQETPPKPPIVFASKQMVGTLEQPVFRFTVDLKVDATALFDNLIDPTV